MNLLLLREGYPPVSIGPEQRADSIRTLQERQIAEPLGHGVTDEGARRADRLFLMGRLLSSLEDHLTFIGDEPPPPTTTASTPP